MRFRTLSYLDLFIPVKKTCNRLTGLGKSDLNLKSFVEETGKTRRQKNQFKQRNNHVNQAASNKAGEVCAAVA